MTRVRLAAAAVVIAGVAGTAPGIAALRADRVEYLVLATSKTSTMEKEMNQAADTGYRFAAVMGGETAIGGKEVVVVMTRIGPPKPRYQYKLLATNRTSTLQKELNQAADAGFEYRSQTVFESAFGGQEVSCIVERDRDLATPVLYQYLLLATTKTSTMQKELQQAGEQGYEAVGMTVGKTAMGGSELVTITRRKR